MEDKKTEINLQVGNKYLMESYNIKYEAYVEKITNKAYKLRIEQVDGNWIIDWVDKEKFNDNFYVIELLEESAKMPLLYNDNIFIEKCSICNGDGKIPANNMTAREKLYPKCWGTGYDISL